jgi:peptide-methionine (S)-S-oxide reductase
LTTIPQSFPTPSCCKPFGRITPTQLNHQGPDWGTQYRSAIFFHTPEQEGEAKASKENLEKSHRYGKPIVTQIASAVAFYEAEDYHQQYLEKRGLATCHIK